ncbi:DUF3999 domain-containing protein [Vulcaniibacterium gelatinicum]|uniref:DUF3999 domain-containing protein n=1 Tax=Vulcaniibacterium gelatinicum TaxID=2598725 RepID=UPI0011CAEF74|nr:DUF3999 domain-containing protein [Vulcaniibacterium gelatinicum]
MTRVLIGCLLLPALAWAGPREDYARQWPLTLARDDAGAYRVTLDDSVYRQLQSPALRDLVVLDRSGTPVPTAVFAPEQPLARSTRRLAVPFFPLPASAPAGAQGWELVSEADADGRLRRVEARTRGASAEAPRTALLVDLSRVREPVVALVLHWAAVEALDVGYRVEASDDLDHWQAIATRGRLVDLRRDGRHLLHRRIELFGLMPHYQRARYLRLTPDRAEAAFEVTAVEAELASTVAPSPLQWRELAPRAAAEGTAPTFDYDLGGPFPVRAAEVALAGNHALRWRLSSRDDEEAEWRPRVADGLAYRIAPGTRSQARMLDAVVRDRHWRLDADGAVPGTPRLRLGYRPEVVVFVAQGEPPYTLVAGSARAQREEAPLEQLVAAVRRARGRDWQPAPAYLGSSRELAGEAALVPRRDWKTWLLWGVLVLGAAVVAGFALSLLRRSHATGA